jgi:hypothetical protein
MMSRWAWGQATPSMQVLANGRKKRAKKKRSSMKKRGKTRVSAAKVAKTKRKSRVKPNKLKKGSAAAKAYMAKIRKMRKK